MMSELADASGTSGAEIKLATYPRPSQVPCIGEDGASKPQPSGTTGPWRAPGGEGAVKAAGVCRLALPGVRLFPLF